ncbi:hypothetical protein [Tropicimonas isoalkanivorans]|uniref:Antifreeze glycopeptide polyprotein n=1 Tax=Tropicimonas isoalkanivorans TaxID=441112 RepID=A0A1I1LDT9_9RHOB|nr:hypothetical protein [Tropicimonas isoalkanivorans]SFC71327.1 hypothetical protein SAMN04488094_10877 [Tropicimonas isoalkanivorans]
MRLALITRLTRVLLPLAVAGSAAAQTDTSDEPISAIDWLSQSLATSRALPEPQAPVTSGIVTEPILVQPLDSPSPDGVGLLPRTVTGLPADLWGESKLEDLAAMIASFPAEPLPAVQDQFIELMMAELDPPVGSTPRGPMLQARIDALLARGAVTEAEALLERASSDEPELFRRAFDVGLLTGREQAACARMRAVPGITPSFPVRIFCLARTGDWPAAALTLESAKALGQLSPEQDALLAQFLDPGLSEILPPTATPSRPSPLTFRMLEAIGAPMPTASLPLAFAHSDLRHTAGWKARIESAERLARAGVLAPHVLLAIYGEREPAASGSVWERAELVQRLQHDLDAGDAAAVSASLPPAWEAMTASGLAVPFAKAFGQRLSALELEGPAAGLAPRIGLLSDGFEAVADTVDPTDDLAFAASIARGTPEGDPPGRLGAAIAEGLTADAPTTGELAERAAGNHLGEALILALEILADGSESDPNDLAEALAFLRGVGLEDTARRAALQILLLDGEA